MPLEYIVATACLPTEDRLGLTPRSELLVLNSSAAAVNGGPGGRIGSILFDHVGMKSSEILLNPGPATAIVSLRQTTWKSTVFFFISYNTLTTVENSYLKDW